MLRGAIWLFLACAGAVVLALVLRANHGNIAILWPPYRIELSSNMALVLTVLAFFVLHVVLLAIGKTLAMPQRIRNYRERRRHQRSSRALQAAVLALFEGRYDRAERLAATAVATSSGDGDAVAAASLVAARSAHRLGAPERRDAWRSQSSKDRRDNPAALMVQAEFALDDQQPGRALDAVDRMTPGGAQQPIALETALGAYQQAGRWDRVLDTVRQLSKRGRMSPTDTTALRLNAYRNMLAPREGDARAIRELWKSLRADERKAPELAAPTVAALARGGAPDDARKIALAVLDAGYDEATVEAYGAMAAAPPRQRLEQLERWRARHGDRSKLLEMLGRVCASEKLWGKAEAYLLGSLAAGDTVSARVALAQLYESIGRPKDAALQFQLAARLALGERLPLPGVAGTAGSLGGMPPPGGVTGAEGAGHAPVAPALGALSGAAAASAAAAAGGAAAAAGAAGVATADSNDPDEASSLVTAGDVGAVPPIARPDRQDLQDRAPLAAGTHEPAAGTADAGRAGVAQPGSDAAPAVDLEAGAGDEVGVVGRKE